MRAAALPWSHTGHYYDVLLRALPAQRGRALDIGCGEGQFARVLAERFEHVEALDRDPAAVANARTLCADAPNVSVLLDDILTHPLEPGAYDLICALASLHHLPFRQAINQVKAALRPGGVFAAIGLWRAAAPFDFLASAVAFPVSHFYRLARLHRLREPASRVRIREPDLTLHEICALARELLPGAKLRRHLLWRYTLVWTRPADRGEQ
jgi:SAM-dependent methyltransferase